MWPHIAIDSGLINSDPHRYLYWPFSIWPEMAFGLSQRHSNSEPWGLNGLPRYKNSKTMYLLYSCQWKRYQNYRLLQTIDILWDVPFSIENYYERLSFFLNISSLADTGGDVGWSWPEVACVWLRSAWSGRALAASGWVRPSTGWALAGSGWVRLITGWTLAGHWLKVTDWGWSLVEHWLSEAEQVANWNQALAEYWLSTGWSLTDHWLSKAKW
jgi:hypothetical protein